MDVERSKNKLTRIKKTPFDKSWTEWSHFSYSIANSTPANSTGFSFPLRCRVSGGRLYNLSFVAQTLFVNLKTFRVPTVIMYILASPLPIALVTLSVFSLTGTWSSKFMKLNKTQNTRRQNTSCLMILF